MPTRDGVLTIMAVVVRSSHLCAANHLRARGGDPAVGEGLDVLVDVHVARVAVELASVAGVVLDGPGVVAAGVARDDVAEVVVPYARAVLSFARMSSTVIHRDSLYKLRRGGRGVTAPPTSIGAIRWGRLDPAGVWVGWRQLKTVL